MTRSDPASSVQLSTNLFNAVVSPVDTAWYAWRTAAGSAFSGRSTNSLESLKMEAFCTAFNRSLEQNISLVKEKAALTTMIRYGLHAPLNAYSISTRLECFCASCRIKIDLKCANLYLANFAHRIILFLSTCRMRGR